MKDKKDKYTIRELKTQYKLWPTGLFKELLANYVSGLSPKEAERLKRDMPACWIDAH